MNVRYGSTSSPRTDLRIYFPVRTELVEVSERLRSVMMRVAINGFGRIGRSFLRCVEQDTKNSFEVVAINIGNSQAEYVAHMFKYDTLMGKFPGDVAIQGDELVINSHRIKIITELDPEKLPWRALNIDWVVDCTGKFTHR